MRVDALGHGRVGGVDGVVHGVGFTLARKAACFSQKAAMASWPKVMAASMSSSEISAAPASTMEM